MPPEMWRPVAGFEALYEVSDRGRVRSVDRVVDRYHPVSGHQRLVLRGRLKATVLQRLGYVNVMLWSDGRYKSVRVHRLVLEAFVGPCPAGMETRHLNGRRGDNRLVNLTWGTHEENARDQILHGTARSSAHIGPNGEDVCQRGHRLAAPNLVAYAAKRGGRICLACSRATNSWYWHRQRTSGVDREAWVQERSDENYRQITTTTGGTR